MRSVRRGLLALLLGVSLGQAYAQDSVVVTEGFPQQEGWNVRRVTATVAVGGLLAGSLVSSYFDWWQGDHQPLHAYSEGFWNDYSLGIDKFGHAYTSYFYFHTFRNMMLWGGFSDKTATWWAFGTAAFFAVSIEIGDGFSQYGFSFEDLTANTLGLTYGYLQTRFPFLRNINLKWTYYPADGFRFPPHFTDHYDGHTYWFTFNMHNLLPEPIGKAWPEWLQLAAGYSVDDHVTKRELAIGLDLNLRAFSTEQPEVLLLRNTFDMFHYPAPAVKFTEDKEPRWFLLHRN